ncbi:penicillin-binding protein [Paenibacillus sp. J31TS4]|uniref:serine hydrolase domain-containing protein n=1 Tax=Paenibacillus sp. J31TS4 TaxID=2807195 RepID=UPI001B072312|nr:serine hydrolase domain-containing protein [Paenibacillus sp. J31TS4]GIP38475.1 penicillin-binding protein [Paenibacillus sp. J31TS4]
MTERLLTPAYAELMAYTEDLNRRNGGSACALYILQSGETVAEAYAGVHTHDAGARPASPDSQYNVASVRKSYIGLAVAWALEQGLLPSLDAPVDGLLPFRQEDAPAVEGVTLRHLLTHTHGLAEEDGRLTRRFAPGSSWLYNNVGIRMLTTLIPAVTGVPVAELLDRLVFSPLGWRETGWRTDASETLVPVIMDETGRAKLTTAPDGSGAAQNLFVSARDLARWGQLHLQGGRWEGRQLVPEAAVRTAVSLQSPPELADEQPANGCLWLVKRGFTPLSPFGRTVPDGSYLIVGFTGPLVLVVPELKLVVVRMTNKSGNYGDDTMDYIGYLQQFTDMAVAATARN